jgi:hypothetical protein
VVFCVSPEEESPLQWPRGSAPPAAPPLGRDRPIQRGLTVLVVRYGKKYYATNRLRLPAADVRRVYHVCAHTEEATRVCKDQLSLSGCQARSERAQLHHITCCLVAFYILERERHER